MAQSFCCYRGVNTHDRMELRWRAALTVGGKMESFGCFNTPEDAAMRYDLRAAELGRKLNFDRVRPHCWSHAAVDRLMASNEDPVTRPELVELEPKIRSEMRPEDLGFQYIRHRLPLVSTTEGQVELAAKQRPLTELVAWHRGIRAGDDYKLSMGRWFPESLLDGRELSWVLPTRPRQAPRGCRCTGELARLHCSRGTCGNAVVRAELVWPLKVVRMEARGRGAAGLQADCDIPSGQFVIEYIGEVLTEKEADRREDYNEDKKCFYMLDVENHDCAQYTIDTALIGNASRFVNHSCDPNMAAYDVYEHDGCPPRIIFITMRDVPRGEELTINYHPSQSAPKVVRQQCRCGSLNCCGWLF
eukprot:TRINITY_DN30905_c0_g1_i1.p1 TRINITY_DN30905_c0_g1~~TRINITY_DN30905_c0_g1_i1.p1  ORF type:complete len:359 (+),score=62.68 TRINITY_DN30905_c0_g1_i1:238-1314(+)